MLWLVIASLLNLIMHAKLIIESLLHNNIGTNLILLKVQFHFIWNHKVVQENLEGLKKSITIHKKCIYMNPAGTLIILK